MDIADDEFILKYSLAAKQAYFFHKSGEQN